MKSAPYIKSCFTNDGLRRLLNLAQAYLVFKARPRYVRGQPVMAVLEPTNQCPLKCEMCVRPKLGSLKLGSMSYDNFVCLLGQFDYLVSLALVGLGEPFLNQDLPKMIHYAKRTRKIPYIWVSTNGMVLDNIGYKEVNSMPVEDMLISFDAASADTYEKIRKGASFSRLIKNIEGLMEVKRSSGKGPKIILVTVATNTNSEELFEVVKVAASLGVDKLRMITVNSDYPNSPGMVFNDPSKEAGKLQALARRLHLAFEYSKFAECFEPWLRPYITWDGYLTPCASRPNAEEINFGNVFEKPLAKIWNSKDFQAFRSSRPSICRRCPRTWK